MVTADYIQGVPGVDISWRGFPLSRLGRTADSVGPGPLSCLLTRDFYSLVFLKIDRRIPCLGWKGTVPSVVGPSAFHILPVEKLCAITADS